MVATNQAAYSRAKLIASAERELSAFFRAVAGSFGAEEATFAAKDWLRQLEGMKTPPASARQLRLLSINASAKLAKRVNSAGYEPSAKCRLHAKLDVSRGSDVNANKTGHQNRKG
jgi:hypothetical protein